jgi:hypothetical protein
LTHSRRVLRFLLGDRTDIILRTSQCDGNIVIAHCHSMYLLLRMNDGAAKGVARTASSVSNIIDTFIPRLAKNVAALQGFL